MSHCNVLIKIGEIITIKDGSYMVAICPEQNILTRFPKIKDFNGSLVELNHEYIVVAVNVSCPQEKDISESLSWANNCIIKDLTNNVIWFCSEINIKTKRNLLELK